MDRELNEAFFKSLVDFEASSRRVRERIALLATGEDVLRFFVRYASWNGHFANGVAALASLIGSSTELFREPGFPRAVADRSNYIASFIFDAARDEYDDHINPIRDTHRCMAQASLISMSQFFKLDGAILDEPEPAPLQVLNADVLSGYSGQAFASSGLVGRVFAGIGYHLGSELLADREFSLIDAHLRSERDDLVQHLMRSTVELAGGKHRCYAWVGVHSGHGGGVEADHFDYALSGVKAAFAYLVGDTGPVAMAALVGGFTAFAQDHERFFGMGG